MKFTWKFSCLENYIIIINDSKCSLNDKWNSHRDGNLNVDSKCVELEASRNNCENKSDLQKHFSKRNSKKLEQNSSLKAGTKDILIIQSILIIWWDIRSQLAKFY